MMTNDSPTTPSRCSECTHLAQDRAEVFDLHTRSLVTLCPHCLPAVLARQHLTPGYCGM